MQTNYIFKIMMAVVVLFTLSACESDLSMTSTKPNLQEPSEALMKGMLTTAYSTLTTDRSGYGLALWGAINGCDTDESFYKNTNNADLTTVGLHNINSTTTTYVQESWRTFYEMIESCNIVLDMAKTVNMDNAKKADMVGQAMTLRAYAHFMLAVHFGPVPIRNIPVHLMGNLDLPRDSVKNVCAFAVKELRAAVPMLNEITSTQTTTYITKSVAEGLSLRVGLYMASHPDIKNTAMYDSVAVWGRQLIDRGVHQLNTGSFSLKGASGNTDVLPGYAKIFVSNMMNIVSTSSNPEGMWDCSFYMKSSSALGQNPYQSWNNGYVNWLGSDIGVDCEDPSYGTSKIGYSKAYYRPQHTLWAKYEPGDVRRDWNISPYLYKNTNGVRYYYINCKLPSAMGSVADTAKLQFIVKGEKLVDATVIEKGGSGYTDGTYTQTVTGYTTGWSANAPSAGTGTKFTITVAGGTVTNVKMVGTSASGYMNVYTRGIGKWRREYELNPTSPREQYNTSCNFPILRYADVLLMTAEAALFKTGGNGASVADGIKYLNQIRSRAGLSTPINSYDLSYIKDERSRELCFEGLRRMDLIRWSDNKGSEFKAVYDKIVNDVLVYGSDGAATPAYKNDAGVNSAANYDPRPIYAIKALMNNYVKYSLMPIPNNEISRASNTFYQNQGW